MTPSTARALIEEQVAHALTRLRNADEFLLANDVHEQSITHRLALYLQIEFPDLNVDCEYNRYGHFDINEVTRSVKRSRPRSRGRAGKAIRPDIVVHVRGDNSQNKLVIEAKKRKRNGGISRKDMATLSWLTESSYSDDDDRGYEFGLYLAFIGSDKLELTWFDGGQKERPIKWIARRDGLSHVFYEQVSSWRGHR